MRRLKSETFLDGLLAFMVVVSLLLSALLWFPAAPAPSGSSGGTSVQELPPASSAAMPVIHRPDRILIQRADGKMALLMSSSTTYDRFRNLVVNAVNDLKEPAWVMDPHALPAGITISLSLPYPLTLDELASEWAWDGLSGRGGSFKVDQIDLSLVDGGQVRLGGAAAGDYLLGPISAAGRQQLLDAIKGLDEAEFKPYRPLQEVAGVKFREPLWVPDVTSAPDLSVVVETPDRPTEEARFFPDLSVVRQIDEQGAISLTDGQRLLRLTDQGILEFNSAQPNRETGTPVSQMEVIRRWVDQNGGWPGEVVLTRSATQDGRSLYQFELRLVGPYPVESNGGALTIQITGNQVLTYRRYPKVAGLRPGGTESAIRTPEQALAIAAGQVPMMTLMPLREVYLSYQIQPGDAGRPWIVEPMWVFHTSDWRVLVPARRDAANLHASVIR